MEAVVDKKDNEPRSKRMLAFIPFIVCLFFAVVLIPLGVLFLKPMLAKPTQTMAVVPSTHSVPSATSSLVAATSVYVPSKNPVPSAYAATIFDPSTWLDLDFNTTFTAETVFGLPVMGLWSDWSDTARPNPFVSPLLRPLNAPVRSCSLNWLTRHENGSMVHIKDVLEHHYASVSLGDFEQMADAGLNFVRIALPHWMVTPIVGESYLPMVGWRYFLRALEWARQTGLRVEVQLLPGRSSIMVERAVRFLSQPRYENLVTMISAPNCTNLSAYGFQGSVAGADYTCAKMQFSSLAEVCTSWPSRVQHQLSEFSLEAGGSRLERAYLKDVSRSLISVFEQGTGWVFDGWPRYREALDAGVLLNFNSSRIDLWCDSGVRWPLMGLSI